MSQIKSKERVAERGEVFTAEREVNAMCDLVANECLRPDSRFLEPACGDGNFLAVILKRKLAELRRKYKKSPRDYEKQAIVAIGSLYGVDIMNDNVIACRERLYKIWNEEYTDHCKNEASDETRDAAKFIISRNIINGNALTLMCVDANGKDTSAPIVFSEWTLIGATQMQRSDYTMSDLLLYNDNSEGNLFALTEEQKEEGGIFLRRYITHYKKYRIMENSLFKSVYNPDVLSCIANLSNDEVFTPPELANKIIDMLPQELFENLDTTFLDPCCKSGVFLREIAKRLIKGLEQQIPNLEKRIEHIFSKQLFGIAITELTSLLSRRSVYCSKFPSSEFSAYQFPEDKPQGNIIYQRIKHTWKDGKCIYCGASQSEYDRGAELETHAYQFIHNLDVKKVFNMKFDVIIGNPPYQMSDGGGTGSSAMPIYHKFIQQAKKLNPRYLTMIVPSRWFTGGKGLDDFRDEMLHDEHIREIHDFGNANDCFPGVAIEGGVCYFLWNRDQKGLCKVFSHSQNKITAMSERPLLEKGADVFIRYNEVISIIRKVASFNEESFSTLVSPRNPYYFRASFVESKNTINTCKIFGVESGKRVYKNIDKSYIERNIEELSRHKIFISKADGAAGQIGYPVPARILGKSEIAGVNTACTETFLRIGPFDSEQECKNVKSYIETKFFRCLVGARKNKNMTQSTYSFVPIQDFSKPWTDKELYEKYNLAQEEIEFIESMITSME